MLIKDTPRAVLNSAFICFHMKGALKRGKICNPQDGQACDIVEVKHYFCHYASMPGCLYAWKFKNIGTLGAWQRTVDLHRTAPGKLTLAILHIYEMFQPFL